MEYNNINHNNRSKRFKIIMICIATVVALLAIAIVVAINFGRSMKNALDERANIMKEEVHGIVEAIEEDDFEQFESYFADSVRKNTDLRESYQEIRDYLGDMITAKGGRVSSTYFSKSGSGYRDEIAMEWEISTADGSHTLYIERVFDSIIYEDGVTYLQIVSESGSVYTETL